MRDDRFAQAIAWKRTSRIIVLSLLALSAIPTLTAALVFSLLGSGENAKLIAAGLWLFGGAAVAVAVGFRKLHQPTWKHWLTVAILAAPGALSVMLR